MSRRLNARWGVLITGLMVTVGLAVTGEAAAQPSASSHGCASSLRVNAPAAGQSVTTPAQVGLPEQARSLIARASKIHARWMSSITCRTLPWSGRVTPTTSTMSARAPEPMAATEYSSNWSGYFATTARTPSTVTATWTEPSVSLPSGSSEAHSAVWVGLGGMSNDTSQLVQDGTGQDIAASGSDHFFWYELYPYEDAVAINLPLAAGDQVTATSSWANGTATFGLCNLTRSVCVSYSQASTAPDNTAEWIVEAPLVNGQQATPPVFTPVTFSGASYGAPTSVIPSAGNAEAIGLVNGSGTTLLASPGALSSGSFTVYYGGPPTVAVTSPPSVRPSLARSVRLTRGPVGGALTVVASWLRPATARPAVNGYQVRIVTRNSRKRVVATRIATTSHLSLAIIGKRGNTYRVQIRAHNRVGWGAWTSWSTWVAPR